MAGLFLAAAGLATPAWGQSSYAWNPASTSNVWLNSANWTGGPPGTAPGVGSNGSSLIHGNTGDIATFGTLGFAGTQLGIDFSASPNTGVGNNTGANGLLSLGAIVWQSTTSNVTLGKSDNLTATGTLRLNGATATPGLAPIPDLLAAIGDAATTNLTIGNTVASGTGTLRVQLGLTNGNFYVATGRNLTIASGISELNAGSGFTKLGGGILTISGAGTYTGSVAVQSGVLSVAANTALGIGAGTVSVANNAAVSLKIGVTVTGKTISLIGTGGPATAGNGYGALQAAASSTATWNGPVILDDPAARVGAGLGGTLILSGGVADGTSTALNISAATGGTVILGGTNTYSGPTNIIRGTLKLAASNALPTTTILNVDSSNAAETATFDLNGFDQTVAGIVRSNPAGGGGSIVVTSTDPSALLVDQATDTVFSGAILGNVTVTKTGPGPLELSGANAFTGSTSVSGGTLQIGADGLSATAGITVHSGGTLLLHDTGDRVTDAAPFTLAGGRLDFGALSGESENLGALILSANSVIDFGSGSGNTLRFQSLLLGGNTLSIWNWTGSPYGAPGGFDPGTPASQDRLLFNTNPGIVGTTPQVIFYSDSGISTVDVGQGKQIVFGSPASAFEIVPVPEPGSIFAATALLGTLAWRERRRWFGRRPALQTGLGSRA